MKCAVDDCESPAKGRGWCAKHYMRFRRTGSPDIVRRVVSHDGPLATFWANVDKRGPDECWPWTRSKTARGYGQIQWYDRKLQYVHRIAYVLAYGEIPEGDPDDPIEIDHICHDYRVCGHTVTCPHRRCCNPTHLVAKPRSENTGRSAFSKGKRCVTGCTCGRHPVRASAEPLLF